ncbi:MAG: hypothetical protein ABEK17_01740 [Candidatus Aenigmatarchaeota archaeon]
MRLKIFLLLLLIGALLISHNQEIISHNPVDRNFFEKESIMQQKFDLGMHNNNFIRKLGENKWRVFYLNISLFVMIYFSAVFLIPYTHLAIDIRNLEKKESEFIKTRRKIEKNYFKRKIDKKTFRKLLTENRNDLYQIRSKLKDREKRFKELNRKVFYPNEFFPYFKMFKEYIEEKI